MQHPSQEYPSMSSSCSTMPPLPPIGGAAGGAGGGYWPSQPPPPPPGSTSLPPIQHSIPPMMPMPLPLTVPPLPPMPPSMSMSMSMSTSGSSRGPLPPPPPPPSLPNPGSSKSRTTNGGQSNANGRDNANVHAAHQPSSSSGGGDAAAASSSTSTSYKPTLRRNQACLQCRRRKLRCDAAKPVCKTCIRSHAHAVRTNSVPDPRLECTYEDGPGAGGSGAAGSTSNGMAVSGDRSSNKRSSAVMAAADAGAGGHGSDDGGHHDHANANGVPAPCGSSTKTSRQSKKDVKTPDERGEGGGSSSSKRRKANSGSKAGPAQGGATSSGGKDFSGMAGKSDEEVARMQSKIAWLETQLAVNPAADEPGVNWMPDSTSTASAVAGNHDTHLLDMLSTAAAGSSSSSATGGAPNGASGSVSVMVEEDPTDVRPLAPSATSTSSYLPPSAQRRARPGEHSIHEMGIGAGWGSTAANHIPYEIIAPVPRSTIKAAQDSMMPTVTEQRRKEREQPRVPTEPDKVLLDILYPGWPVDLPDPNLMEHLIDCFFQFVPSVNRIFVYDSFKTRMTLPPSSDNFPDEAILHAICAVSARYTARVVTVDSQSEPWKQAPQFHENPALEPDFGIRHSLFAKKVIDRNLAAGVRIYESAQALACLSNHYHSYARWVEGWVGIGMLNRIVVPLGLTNDTMICGPGGDGKTSLIGPARSDIEREERRALLWTAIIYDVQTSTASGWSGGIQLDEITTPLPASLAAIESGLEVPPNEQTAHSLDLFTRHPVIDGFTMHVKAHILLHRVSKFCRLWKATQFAQPANVDGRAMNEFKDLDGMIGTFVLTFPPALRDPLAPLKGRVYRPFDIDLFGAQVLLHQMAILLHEPFANLDDADDMSTRRLISSARGILKMIYLVTSTSLDLCLLVRYQLGFWTAARTLVLFLKYSLDTGNTPGGPVETLRSEIEVFRLTFVAQASRFPISARHVTMLETLVNACSAGGPPASSSVNASTANGGNGDRFEGGGYSGAGDVLHHATSSPARSAAVESPAGGDQGSVSGFSASNWSVTSTLPLSQLLDKKRGFVGPPTNVAERNFGSAPGAANANMSGDWSTRSQGSSSALAPDGDRFTP